MNSKNIFINLLIILSISLFISTIAFAIPNSISVQGKLTSAAGAIQTGTFNFTFRIYDSFTSGNLLYETNVTSTTDSRGVYDILIKNVNLSFEEHLYLAVRVNNDAEMEPRINLTSVPYTFRANTSEDLNKNKSYTAANLNATGNLTLGNRLTFGLGQFIDNLVSGWLKLTGALNVTSGLVVGGGLNVSEDFRVNQQLNITSAGNLITSGSINASGSIQGAALTDGNVTISSGIVSAAQVNVGGGFSAGGLTLDTTGNIITQGDVLFSGNVTVVNVSFLSVNGSLIPGLDNQFDIGNASLRWRNANFSNIGEFGSVTTPTIRVTNIQNLAGTDYGFVRGIDFNLGNISNYTQYTKSADFNLGNISNNTLVKGDNSSISLWNISGTDIFPRFITGNVGIGTTLPAVKLVVIGNVNISDSLNVSGTVQANKFVGDGSLLTGISTGQIWNSSGNKVFLNDSTANVGIGTINPLQKLEISGNVLVNNTANAFVNLSGPILKKSGDDIVISD